MDSGFQERWWPGPIQDVTKLDGEASVIGSNDRTHVLKGFVTWAAPRGWTFSTLVRYESGLPLAITSSNYYAGWMYPIYANRNPLVSLGSSFDSGGFDPVNPANPANQYFNPGAFSNPPYGSLGSGPGRFEELRGFGGAYEDLSVMKNIALGRNVLQFKADVLNLFNRHYLANPVTDISSPLFGNVTTAGSQPPRQVQLGIRYQW